MLAFVVHYVNDVFFFADMMTDNEQLSPAASSPSCDDKSDEYTPTKLKHYPGTVTVSEINVMKIRATFCRRSNSKARKKKNKEINNSMSQICKNDELKVNDSFYIKYSDDECKSCEIDGKEKHPSYPTSLCPDQNRHFTLLNFFDLPLACPTCWGVQRNACIIATNLKSKSKVKES